MLTPYQEARLKAFYSGKMGPDVKGIVEEHQLREHADKQEQMRIYGYYFPGAKETMRPHEPIICTLDHEQRDVCVVCRQIWMEHCGHECPTNDGIGIFEGCPND